MTRTLQSLAFLTASVMASITVMPISVGAESYSNRHHLSGCTRQSAPVIIPYANHRTVQLGLPADVGGNIEITELYGVEEETRLRLRPRGLSITTQGGGARMIVHPRTGC